MAEKVALVTGGTSGIGLETARALARAKVRVTILSRTPGEYEFPHIACDVTDPVAARAAVQAVVAREGRLDILVNASASRARSNSPTPTRRAGSWRPT